MSMSRKHFEALAGMVREFHDYDDVRELAPDWWARKLADFCGNDSGAFNRVRFLEACKPGCSYPAEPVQTVERAQAAEDSVTVAGPTGSWWAPTYEAVCVEGHWRVNEYWPGSTLVRRHAPFGWEGSCRDNARRALETLSAGADPYLWNVGESDGAEASFWVLPLDTERFVLASMPKVGGEVLFGVLDRDTGALCHWSVSRPGIDSEYDQYCLRALTLSRELGSPPRDYVWTPASRFDGPASLAVVHDDRVLSSG